MDDVADLCPRCGAYWDCPCRQLQQPYFQLVREGNTVRAQFVDPVPGRDFITIDEQLPEEEAKALLDELRRRPTHDLSPLPTHDLSPLPTHGIHLTGTYDDVTEEQAKTIADDLARRFVDGDDNQLPPRGILNT